MKKFKRGDVREDGKVFLRYKQQKECWSTKEQLDRLRTKDLLANNKQCSDKLGHALKIIAGRKRSAKLENLVFSVSKESLLKNLPNVCPVLGVNISWGSRVGQKGNKDFSPSLDRLDPLKGYIEGNVFWISFLANRIKSNFTSGQHQAVANWMKQIENQ